MFSLWIWFFFSLSGADICSRYIPIQILYLEFVSFFLLCVCVWFMCLRTCVCICALEDLCLYQYACALVSVSVCLYVCVCALVCVWHWETGRLTTTALLLCQCPLSIPAFVRLMWLLIYTCIYQHTHVYMLCVQLQCELCVPCDFPCLVLLCVSSSEARKEVSVDSPVSCIASENTGRGH